MEPTALIAIAGIAVPAAIAILGGIWRQSNIITKQFIDLKDFVNDKVSAVLTKLEYHEKHDDQRFTRMSDDIWMLRLKMNVPNERQQGFETTYSSNESGDVRRETLAPRPRGT